MLSSTYPWTKLPLVVSAPMLGAATPQLAVNVGRAGGFGFLAGGSSPQSLDSLLSEATELLLNIASPTFRGIHGTLPLGVGFQVFACDVDPLVAVIARHTPSAVWLFAPKQNADLGTWANKIRVATDGKTQIWLQVANIAEMLQGVTHARPDVLVMQGSDAGGHGQVHAASIVSLVPEAIDALRQAGHNGIPVLAAGGIAESRSFAAALALGAQGAVMGTRFLVASESGIAKGWKSELLQTQDGGVTTCRSTLCDRLKETKGWPTWFDGRAIRNRGHDDEAAGMSDAENVQLYKKELQQGDADWGVYGRMVTYAGTGVGLIKREQSAGSIVEEVREGACRVLQRSFAALSSPAYYELGGNKP